MCQLHAAAAEAASFGIRRIKKITPAVIVAMVTSETYQVTEGRGV